MTNSHMMTITLALTAGLVSLACHEPLPCPDCDEQADADAEQEDGEPTPDLPCGGADLMTDNLNCGTCGNACPTSYEGTEWAAGTCVDGECGPPWFGCFIEFAGSNCEEICGAANLTCVANGCSGYTALLLWVGFDGYCEIEDLDLAMDGPCTEPIPWLTNADGSRHAMCCCE